MDGLGRARPIGQPIRASGRLAHLGGPDAVIVGDLGATYLRVALATRGRLGPVTRRRTAELGIDPVLGVAPGIIEVMREVLLAAYGPQAADGSPPRPAAIGLGVPSSVDAAGAIYHGLDFGVPAGTVMRDALEAAFDVPAAVDNDANLATLGEYRRGAGRNTRHFILLTLGTNIGMGVILDGEVFRGATCGAGEAGMLLIPVDTIGSPPDPDGRRLVASRWFGSGQSRAPDGYAWIEELVGGGALAHAADAPGGRSARSGPSPGDGRRRSARVFRQAAAGNRAALDLVDRAIEGWAFTIANLVAILDPEAIALSGGLVGDVEPFLDRLRARAAELSRVPPRIIVAELGAKAGLVGAELAARDAARTVVLAADAS